MKAATRFIPAILILAGFFLIKTCLYRLPTADALHSYNFKSLVGFGKDASTKADKILDLASSSALYDGRFQVTATAQDRASATEIMTTSIGSSSSLDHIVVMGRTNTEDTSWVEKLPASVFLTGLIFKCDGC